MTTPEDFVRFCEDFDVCVAILSRDRADILARWSDRLVSEYTLFHCGKGYDEHEYRCRDRIEVPRGIEGRPAVANLALRTLEHRHVVLLPDDILAIHWLSEDKLFHIDSAGFRTLVINLVVNAQDVGAGLYGISEVDIRKSSPLHPFNMRAMVTGFVGIDRGVPGERIWYDERQRIKADYDFCLQHLKRDRLVWKDLRYFFSQDRNKYPGGQMPFRTPGREELEVQNLRDWWGDDMIRWRDGKTTKKLHVVV